MILATLLGVLGLTLTSCTPPPGPDAANTSAPMVWDPNAWQPTVKITPKTFTEEERWASRAEWLKQLEPKSGPVPEVEFIRWTQSYDDYSVTVSKCLNDAGFPVTPGYRGLDLGEGILESQYEAFELASYKCDSQYSLDPRLTGDWTEEQIGLVYDYLDQYYVPCMKAHNQPVTEDGKPSRESYVSNFFSRPEERWVPYPLAKIPDQIQEICPELPPDNVLYGS